MAHIKLRGQTIELRLKGYTYGQIKRELGISKSTLSDWLKNLHLTEEQLKKLALNRKNSKDVAVERFRETFRTKRLIRLKKTLDKQIIKLLPLTEKELLIAGLFLYWGEGDKKRGRVSISNTDPKIVKFALYWMLNILKIPKDKIRVNLHLYKDMDVKDTTKFWSDTLDIPINQFIKPYIKSTNRSGLTYKSFGYGTCRLHASNTALSEEVAMALKCIYEYYGEKSDLFWYN